MRREQPTNHLTKHLAKTRRREQTHEDLTLRTRFSSRVAARFATPQEKENALDPDVRVVCPETRAELPDGRVGEIWVRGGSVAFGYVTADGFTDGGVFGRDLFLRGDGGDGGDAATTYGKRLRDRTPH